LFSQSFFYGRGGYVGLGAGRFLRSPLAGLLRLVFRIFIRRVGKFCRSPFGFSILFIGEKTFSFIFFLFFEKKAQVVGKKCRCDVFSGFREKGSRDWGAEPILGGILDFFTKHCANPRAFFILYKVWYRCQKQQNPQKG
jgi:hypothetical protein